MYRFLCLCFGLSSAPRIFTKLTKVPIPVFRRLNIVICLYLDGILLIAHSRKEMIVARDTLIFLIQNLGFLINIKKPVYQTCQKIEFLGVIVDSKEINTPLPQEKVLAIIEQCLTCLTCSRAQRDLVHNVPCVLHALNPTCLVPCVLLCLMCLMPCMF